MPATLPRLKATMPLGMQVVQTLGQLSDQHMRLLWRALQQATWSTAVSFKHRLLLFDRLRHTSARIDGFLDSELSPRALIFVIESLHREAVLTRAEATTLEEPLLQRCNQHGGWRTTAETTG